uniref:Uncharacterized protein n=1 Tax=Ixodes ricinus TaxID=34613 RepID=A0A6B0UAN6_IXORI
MRPRLAVGFLMARCSSFKWLPAYCSPCSATKRRRMSLAPSKMRKMRRSRWTLSSPVSRMKPMPPWIWMDSSVTYQAHSDAVTFVLAASRWYSVKPRSMLPDSM